MKTKNFIGAKLMGILDAAWRFFPGFICLFALCVLNALDIERKGDFEKPIIAFVLGFFVFLAGSAFAERFCKNTFAKFLSFALSFSVFALFFTYAMTLDKVDDVLVVQVSTVCFALFIAFVWVPSFGEDMGFSGAFLCAFKAFFTSVFFSLVLFAGLALVLAAFNLLIYELDSDVFTHMANIVWVLLAPLLFLSLLPAAKGEDAGREREQKATFYPKFLETLLSFVLIPLIFAYTLVILVYMIKTAVSGNWSANLLETIVLSYIAAVIILHPLLHRLENPVTRLYLKLAPFFLAAVAAFQGVNSAAAFFDKGMVASRYYILAFCVYALWISALLIFRPAKKKDYFAYLAILCALVCVLPYAGAFGSSVASQSAIVRGALTENGMLQDGKVIKNPDIPVRDKHRIGEGIRYLESVGALDKLEFLPENFNTGNAFYHLFGFHLTEYENRYTEKTLYLDETAPLSVEGYQFIHTAWAGFNNRDAKDEELYTFSYRGETYRFLLENKGESFIAALYKGKTKLLEMPFDGIIDKIEDLPPGETTLPANALSFVYEGGGAKVKIVYSYAFSFKDDMGENENFNATMIILFSLE